MGQALVLAAAVGFGLNPVLAQILLHQGFAPDLIALFRFLIPALVVLPFTPIRCFYQAEFLRTAGVGMVAGLGMLAYFYCLNLLPVSMVILSYYSYPLFALLIGRLWFGLSVSRNRLIAGVLILLAVSLILDPVTAGTIPLWAVVLCFVAPCSFGLLINYFSNPLQPLSTGLRMSASLTGHLVVLVPVSFLATSIQMVPSSFEQLFLVLLFGTVTAAIPQYFFAKGSAMTSMEQTTALASFEVVFALLFASWFLDSELGRLELVASGLIVLAGLIRLEPQVNGKLLSEPN
jgi:drug/metabolite transporter (DMT)-like permease